MGSSHIPGFHLGGKPCGEFTHPRVSFRREALSGELTHIPGFHLGGKPSDLSPPS